MLVVILSTVPRAGMLFVYRVLTTIFTYAKIAGEHAGAVMRPMTNSVMSVTTATDSGRQPMWPQPELLRKRKRPDASV
jgi:hypothetical protein